jgi:short-subunit dehydrogenase
MDEAPRHFFQTPEQVVAATLAANARGKGVVVPGWHNKLAVAVLKLTPEFIAIPLIKRGSAKYHLEDS